VKSAFLKSYSCRLNVFLWTKHKTEPKAGDEIARYDTSFIAIPPSLPSGWNKARSLSVFGTDKVGESLGLTAEVVRTVSVGVYWNKS
jgi:hypothetical protein